VSGELERLAAGCLLPPFEGLAPPAWLLRSVEEGLGGVVLFARNVGGPEQVAALTGLLHETRPDVLVATDEEGGDVTRLEAARGSSYPGNAALGAVDDEALTEEVAAALGRDLRAAGIDLDLAPVADVLADARSPIVGVRSFGADPALVARHVAAFVRGLQGMGVAACAKHFPGHGGAKGDSHVELPTAAGDLHGAVAPFRAAIEAGVRAVMSAHVVVPALDDVPATLSPRVLRGLLREELGFRGLVVTDALEMRAVSATAGIEEGAVRALAAGADALCLGADLTPDDVERVRNAIAGAVRAGRLPEERLAEAGRRVREAALPPAPAGAHVRPDVGAVAARAALRQEGRTALEREPVVVELVPEPSIAAGEAGVGLGALLARDRTVRLAEAPADAAALLARHPGRQLVLVLRDAHRHAWQRAAAEALLAASEDAVVIETGLPLWHPAGARGYLATLGAGRVNLGAAVELLRGGRTATSSAPARP
jgi:beta-N-acetylhexosaminidase